MSLRRESQLERLKRDAFDLLVVGGGATGTDVALDAATRDLRVALIERDDFAAGTSSRSTKLIHGGVRYLELAVKQLDRGQYKLVREALAERATLLRIAPHLVRPLALVTPVYGRFEGPYYRMGLRLYDLIAGKSGLQRSHFLNATEALARFPMLKKEGLRGGVVYYDGQFNDARMNVSLAITAVERGAVVANHVAITGLLKTAGRITGARVRDMETGESWNVRARVVVNATGPHCDFIRRLDEPDAATLLKPSSGTHIVLDRRFAPPDTGLLIPKTEDGRVLFLLPWLGHTLVGTTDNPAENGEEPIPTDADIDYILRQLSSYFTLEVTRKDIRAAWTGLRPLVDDTREDGGTAKLIRDHHIEVSDAGLVTITGGKWTTYRKMAEDTVDQALRTGDFAAHPRPSTERLPLAGAAEYDVTVAVKLEAAYGLPPEVAQYLAESYGDRAPRVADLAKAGYGNTLVAGHPHLEAEVLYGVREEMARTPFDLLARRLRLAFLDRRAALAALPRVTELMAAELHWDAARSARERETASALIRQGPPNVASP